MIEGILACVGVQKVPRRGEREVEGKEWTKRE